MKNILSKKVLVVLAALVLLSGCGKESVYQDLNERDANEILVVLYRKGIDADKERVEGSQKVTYTVGVPRDDIQRARQILVDNNLPRKRALGLELCKEGGLIPTPEEEKCKKLLRLKGEIVNSLVALPGVIDADVVLSVPEVSEFASEDAPTKKPTASAVLRVKQDVGGYDVRESSMQRFISNMVENLDPRDVAVIISYVEPPDKVIAGGPLAGGTETSPTASAPGGLATIAGLQMSNDSLQRFKLYAVAILLVLIGVSIALIFNVIKLTKMRQELKVSRVQGGTEGAAATPLLEGGSQAGVAQLKSGEEEKAPTTPSAPPA